MIRTPHLSGTTVLPAVLGLAVCLAVFPLGQAQAQAAAAARETAGQKAGKISGQVLDTEGLAIPGATVKVTNTADGTVTEVTSNEQGTYTTPDLAPGTYRVDVTAQGFAVFSQPAVVVAAGQTAAPEVKLSIQEAKGESVEVNAAAGGVELDTASISNTLGTKEVAGLGLNGRNFSQLITLTPGVSNQTGQDEAKVGLQGSAKYSVNGGRVEYNTFSVDGSDVLNTSITASRGASEPLMVYPSIDAIQELQVLTSNYSSVYGKSASGSVLITTKSGTKDFHGNVYAFVRNEKFNARNYFDAPGRTPLYRRQDYGGTVGGPVYLPGRYNLAKDKTFFFFSEELRLEKTPVAYNQAVPTVAERGGDFSDVCGANALTVVNNMPVVDSTKYPDCPLQMTGVGFPGYHANVSYTAASLLSNGTIPLPNSVVGCNSTNPTPFKRCYVASISPATYFREELFRIDHKVNANEQLAFRFIHDSWNTTTLTPQWGIVQNSFPTVENYLTGPGLNMVLSLAQTLPKGFLNRISAIYAVQHVALTPQPGVGVSTIQRPGSLDTACTLVTGPTPTPPGPGAVPQQLTECPLGYIFANGFGGNKAPGLIFQGNNGAYGGHGFAADTGFAPWSQANPTYTLRDDATKAVGKHLLQFGGEVVYAQQNELSAVNGANSGDLQGLLTFSNQQSRGTSGNAFADFLAGPGISPLVPDPTFSSLSAQPGSTNTVIKSFQQDSAQRRYYNRYKLAELYLQDDYKVLPHLTLSAGLRASLFGTWYNAKATAYNWQANAYNRGLGASIFVDQQNGFLVRTTGAGATPGTLPVVPLNLASLDPVITNGLVHCDGTTAPTSCQSGHVFNPAPRVGFAWDPFGNGKTSIRAGYGLFWEHGTGFESNTGSLLGGAPLVLSETQTFPSAGLYTGGNTSVQAGAYNTTGFSCQGGTSQCGNTTYPAGVTFPLSVTSIPTKAVYAYAQQWSLSVQHELVKDTVGSLAYVGSKGTHLTAQRNLNQLPGLSAGMNPFLPGQPITSSVCSDGALRGVFPTGGAAVVAGQTSPGIGANSPGYQNAFVACTGNPGFRNASGHALGISADSLRPYLGFSNILSVENVADSSYSGLQASLRRTKGKLTIGFSYTYSHSIDDSSDRASNNFADALNVHANRASSDFDQRHLLNVSYIYELPLVRLIGLFTHFIPADDDSTGATPAVTNWEDGHLAHALLVGWDLSGITSYSTGSPFSVINAGSPDGIGSSDNAGVGNGLGIGSYVDLVGDPHGPRPVVPGGAATANGDTVSSNVGPLLYNPRAYTAPRGLTFGNSGRNSLNNPGRTNFNASLNKHFTAFHENDLEFRAEGFNIFNHTQFRIFDASHPGNTGNNIVNCYGDVSTGYSAGSDNCLAGNSFLHPVDAHDPRILQFGLKLAF